MRLAALLAVVAFGGVFLGTSFVWLALVIVVFAFFWDACLPQLEATTLDHLEGRPGAYARIRLWGSVGFIVAVVGLGKAFDSVQIWWLLPSLSMLLLGVWLFTLTVPESQIRPIGTASGERFYQMFLRPEVAAFLTACFLMQASHGPYYTFYSIYLTEFSYSKSVIGALWALGVVCEIGIFLIMYRVQRHIGLRQVLMVSFGVAALRWILIGNFPDYPLVLIFAQTLHAVTFGAYHAVAIELIHRFFTGRHQCRGQAIYGSVSFGLGGAMGSFYSGLTWGSLGPTVTFELAALCAAVAFIISAAAIKPNS